MIKVLKSPDVERVILLLQQRDLQAIVTASGQVVNLGVPTNLGCSPVATGEVLR